MKFNFNKIENIEYVSTYKNNFIPVSKIQLKKNVSKTVITLNRNAAVPSSPNSQKAELTENTRSTYSFLHLFYGSYVVLVECCKENSTWNREFGKRRQFMIYF